MVNKEKEYCFKESKIYQRIGEAKTDGIIGLDVFDAKGKKLFMIKRH